jgi:hypothetical protein
MSATASKCSYPLLALTVTLSTGCYKWVDIRPVELTKLNSSYSPETDVVTFNGTASTVDSPVVRVERPDGTHAEIKGQFDAEIIAARATMRFRHPVSSVASARTFHVGRPLPKARSTRARRSDATLKCETTSTSLGVAQPINSR